jgi:hypothetical protein
MDWPITGTPTWADRQGYGPALTPFQAATSIALAESTSDLGWRHVNFLATMMAESGLRAWSRPMVWAPGTPSHLTVDRGICALNSYWWAHVDDEAAYDPDMAIQAAIAWIKAHVEDGTRGAKSWHWRPILDWQWHAYGTDRFDAAVPDARAAINQVRAPGANLPPV